MRKRFLAVPDNSPEEFYLEDSAAAVAYVLRNSLPIKFYAIELDGSDVPSIVGLASLGNPGQGRKVREVQEFDIEAGGSTFQTAESEVETP